ncbi:MAG: lipoyl(octanoyl) transferase LipB [Candidatus Omnitrophica bacterium]|nr:lipoyl(octanoyl) transferase LipB [Candidatus Omnitrophota bacterium]
MTEAARQKELFNIIDAGMIEYSKAYGLQRELVWKRKLGLIRDTIILAEHKPVFTIGRRGSKSNLLVREGWLKDRGLELVRTDRGGDITFHGPGQLVLYPVIDLAGFEKDLHLYIRNLEGVIIGFLLSYGVSSMRISGATGVWIESDTKIGSIGIGVTRWVTYHGLSVNVNTPLEYYDMINSCGLESCKMTSLSSVLENYVNILEAKERLIQSFFEIFKRYGTTISSMDKKEAHLL